VAYPVEVKVNIDASRADVVEALVQEPTAASTRRIWFAEDRAGVETGLLPLLASHVVVRLRSGGGVDDLTVKLQPCVEQQLVGRWMTPFETKWFVYRIEGEWSGQRHALSACAVSERMEGSLLEVVGTYSDPAEAITSKQRQFLNQCAPPGVRVDRLVALGPIESTKWTDVPVRGFKVNVERWTAADLDFVELSLRVDPEDGEPPAEFESRVAAQRTRLEASARDLGLPIDTHTDTKTRRVLTSLARIRVHH
jgi:hypothetical protein